ncbi:hypothetical protein ACROYT_G015271 [Oculina patagonica]
MMRLALMFIIQRRRHYDKATLCQLSDLVHHKSLAMPHFSEIFEQALNELTEKKVEVFHSILRRAIPPDATAAQVQETAKAISGSRYEEDFSTWFLLANSRGKGDRNLEDLSFRAADFLINLFVSVQQNLGNSSKIPKGRRKYQPYYLPTLDATIDQRSLPLGYAWSGQEPDPQLACDSTECLLDDDDCSLPVTCLNCGYSFHTEICCRSLPQLKQVF